MPFLLFFSITFRFLTNKFLNEIKQRFSDDSVDYFVRLKSHRYGKLIYQSLPRKQQASNLEEIKKNDSKAKKLPPGQIFFDQDVHQVGKFLIRLRAKQKSKLSLRIKEERSNNSKAKSKVGVQKEESKIKKEVQKK
jgi:hypothetical protein